ncbi:hypothetical protein EJD97_003784 [Solanum chilense]|uniref:Uncharacterized protein n=1 Tax=Solanum chilense TaxID=4083 RepID=A0A6N2AMV0_SOLCI|nr:hypothetical protein EJD97_003784 [Solanum chilense]
MNTRRNATGRLDREIANAGVPPRDDQVPPIEEVANDYQTPVNQAITAQSNREVVPLATLHVVSMASRLRNFTRMNPPTFYGS